MKTIVLKYQLFLAALFAMASGAHAQTYDLVLKGGHVIDPKNGIDSVIDVAVKDGTVARVATAIPAGDATRVLNVGGLYVTPGLIDLHVHVFQGTNTEAYLADTDQSVQPDAHTFRAGVTTVVDAGTSGWKNFRQFKRQTIDRAKTRVLALLNIASVGMVGRLEEQDVLDMNPQQTAQMIQRVFPDHLVGIKAAHFWGDFTQVERAVEAGRLAGVPVMVDFGEHDPPLSLKTLLLEKLRPGDIFTHTYSDTRGREQVVDENGRVRDYVFEAQKRGIVFDVGHGGGSFIWYQAVPSMEQGFHPNTISTDLHAQSMLGGMKDMANTISKFLNMGMSLQDAILRSTWNPAKVIQREALGHLSEGAEADIAVFRLHEGDFGFIDSRGRVRKGSVKLEAELTLRAGQVVWDLNGLAAREWDAEPKRY